MLDTFSRMIFGSFVFDYVGCRIEDNPYYVCSYDNNSSSPAYGLFVEGSLQRAHSRTKTP